jgi:tripartite-type tricarboxylate transporter receptor subunit TctC
MNLFAMKRIALLSLPAAIAFLALQASAQPTTSAFPIRPVRVVASSPPGSPPDALARIIAEPLAAALGQPVLIENRPGGSGTIGMGAVAKAPADGHTLGIMSLTQIVAPSLVSEMPYDTLRDLAPVSQIAWTGNILVVRASSPIKSAREFVAVAKAKPDELTYASAGNGTPSHLASELFKNHAGIEVRHVPFKGIGQGLTSLLGEQVDIAFAGAAVSAPLIRAGRLRALGTASGRRLPAFPDMPTLAELGFAGYQLEEWIALVAPANTPAPVIAKLARELAHIISLPDTQGRLASIGLYPAEQLGPDALRERIQAELPRWKEIVRQTNIRAE